MPKIINAFAVGCFHFVDDRCFDEDFYSPEYALDIKRILNSIDNVSNVEVDIRSGQTFIYAHPPHRDNWINGPFHPIPGSGRIAFDIFLPDRLQKEVFYG
ncbi:MAG: hypothetical protein Q7U11_04805, partial [Phenylobacterium sp.]|nr:hypothetical protein [Phenylobacterium sp.]